MSCLKSAVGLSAGGEAVVLTPHPHAHALYANKLNLCTLTDEHALIDQIGPVRTRQVWYGSGPYRYSRPRYIRGMADVPEHE